MLSNVLPTASSSCGLHCDTVQEYSLSNHYVHLLRKIGTKIVLQVYMLVCLQRNAHMQHHMQ